MTDVTVKDMTLMTWQRLEVMMMVFPMNLKRRKAASIRRWAGSQRTMLWMKQPLQRIWKDWKKRYKMDSSVMLGLVLPGVGTLERGGGGRRVLEVQGETQDRELVPGLMDTGRRAMGWV